MQALKSPHSGHDRAAQGQNSAPVFPRCFSRIYHNWDNFLQLAGHDGQDIIGQVLQPLLGIGTQLFPNTHQNSLRLSLDALHGAIQVIVFYGVDLFQRVHGVNADLKL